MQTVLAIDDAPEIHRLLALRLRREDVVLHHALDAEDGLRKVRDLAPDLVLLDLDLPGVTGFDLCKRLKAEPETAAIPVIFLTAATSVFVKVVGFDLGAIDYVTKPFEAAELRARIRAALRTKRYQDLLARRAHVDGLTGLWNRAYFDQRLREEIAASRRHGRDVSLVMIDLDHFKQLNDAHGHPFGDRVLQRVGELLATKARETDAACRYGGEEFAMILSDTPLEGAMVLAERLRVLIAGIALHSGEEVVRLSASLGVAATEHLEALDPRTLVDAADAALYAAKDGGRNRVCGPDGDATAFLDPPLAPRSPAPLHLVGGAA
jgi:two-component system, cell cycle response regulator